MEITCFASAILNFFTFCLCFFKIGKKHIQKRRIKKKKTKKLKEKEYKTIKKQIEEIFASSPASKDAHPQIPEVP